MISKKADVLIIILLLISILVSAYSFISNTNNEQSFEPKDAMNSVIELECWDDPGSKVYGTGFIIDRNGPHVITNCHMVIKTESDSTEKYEFIKAKYANRSTYYDLELISFDVNNDLAVLDFIDHTPNSTLNINSERPSYGEDIYVIGNAMGYGLSVKEGVVSIPEINVNNDGTVKNCVMISITINHGDSGSPIINSKGEVIGISSFKLKDDGKSVEGMSYGITARTIVEFLKNVQ